MTTVSLNSFLTPAQRQAANNGRMQLDHTLAIQTAIQSVTGKAQVLLIPPGTYRIDGTLIVSSKTNIKGSGANLTLLKKKRGTSGHIMDAISTTQKSGILISDLTFDSNLVDSGLVMYNVQDSSIKTCTFKNHPFWGISLGIADSHSKRIVNRRVTISACAFVNTTKSYEHLLIFNSVNITVSGCSFSVAPDATGIGLWQLCDRINITSCKFSHLTRGIYYSLSTNNITITGSSFQTCQIAVRGANTSDRGNFGYSAVRNLFVQFCTFTKNHGPALCIGGVIGALVNQCTFTLNDEECIHLSPDQATLIKPTKQVKITNCTFTNNNCNKIGVNGAPIKVESGSMDHLTIVNCTWIDNRAVPLQTAPIVFKHMYFYDFITIQSSKVTPYSNAFSITLVDGARLGRNVSIVASTGNFSNLPTSSRVSDELRRRINLLLPCIATPDSK
jgi:hypothetical protein